MTSCAPERISLQVRALQRYPEAVLCSSDFSAFNAEGRVSASHGPRYYSAIGDAPGGLNSLVGRQADLEIPAGAWPSLQEPLCVPVHVGRAYPHLAFGNFVHPPTSIMVRREILEGAGPFDESLRWTSDWECDRARVAARALRARRTGAARLPAVEAADVVLGRPTGRRPWSSSAPGRRSGAPIPRSPGRSRRACGAAGANSTWVRRMTCPSATSSRRRGCWSRPSGTAPWAWRPHAPPSASCCLPGWPARSANSAVEPGQTAEQMNGVAAGASGVRARSATR